MTKKRQSEGITDIEYVVRKAQPYEIADVERDVRKVLEGFEVGVFLRDVRDDGKSDWAIRLFPYLTAMARLQKWLEERSEKDEGRDVRGPGA